MPSRNKKAAAGPAGTGNSPLGRPELIVVLHSDASVTVQGGQIVPGDRSSQALLAPVSDAPPDLLDAAQVRIRPLFTSNPERLAVGAPPEAGRVVSPLGQYFIVDGVIGDPGQLLEQLRAVDVVAGAYLKPAALPPAPRARAAALNAMAPRAEEPPAVTPDLTGRQGYLAPAPGGVDAQWAWTQPGGRGENVHVIDVEGAWRLSHEDLLPRHIGVSGGTPPDDVDWRNHGTAVTGVIGSAQNGFGTTGIAPNASLSTISIFGANMSSASAIKLAADALNEGDILLIELHRPGPLAAVVGQLGYIAVEWWPDDYDAIVYAVSRSIIVVEAGGNGSQNLDDPAYDAPQAGFPSSWRNPFRRGPRDSGAIVVGAGAPPPGTHGNSNWGPDRSRLDFSNFGSMIDAQGWGREVTTCGYGDLQGGSGSEDYWYTDQFSGTSSASPIIAGSLACAQSILRAAGTTLLTPQTARRFLRATGSPQQAGPQADVSQRIGNRPDIRALVSLASEANGKEGQKEKEQKEQKEQKEKEQEGGKSFLKLEKNEFKEMLEQGQPQPGPEDATSGLEAKVAAVEDAVAKLRHFISPEQRPDLTVLARGESAAAAHSEMPGGKE